VGYTEPTGEPRLCPVLHFLLHDRVWIVSWSHRVHLSLIIQILSIKITLNQRKLNNNGHHTEDKLEEGSFLINVVVEGLTLLLRIREVTSSNLGSKTGYSDWGVLWFSSLPPYECRVSILKICHDVSFQIIFISSFTFIRRYMVFITEKASLNTL
jgi:hypothetical protein